MSLSREELEEELTRKWAQFGRVCNKIELAELTLFQALPPHLRGLTKTIEFHLLDKHQTALEIQNLEKQLKELKNKP